MENRHLPHFDPLALQWPCGAAGIDDVVATVAGWMGVKTGNGSAPSAGKTSGGGNGGETGTMKVVSSWFRGTWLVILVAAIVIALDQITKEWVRATIEKYTYIVPIPRLGNYFVLEHVENNGAAFGILQDQNRPLIIVALVVAVAILIYAPRIPQDQWLIRVFLGLQLGGALANVMDRINHGYVTDFVRIGVPGVFYWPSFNVADSAIVVGVIGLGVMIIRDDIRREREAKAAADPLAAEAD